MARDINDNSKPDTPFVHKGSDRIAAQILKQTNPSRRFNNDLAQDYMLLSLLHSSMGREGQIRQDLLDSIVDVYYSCDDGWSIKKVIEAIKAGVPQMRGMKGFWRRNQQQQEEPYQPE